MKLQGLLLSALFFIAPGLAAAEPQLALPKGAKAGWAVPAGKALASSARFVVDHKGGVWLLPVPRVLAGPKGAAVVLDQPLNDLAMSGQQLYGSTELIAGPLKLRKLKGGQAGRLERKLLLPASSWRLAESPGGPAVFGFDPEQGKGLLFRLNGNDKILEWPERILAAVGTSEGWFLAAPSGIVRVSASGAMQAWGSLPGGASSLAWVEGAGLAAAGPQGVGLFSGPDKLKPLLKGHSPRVRAKGASLYILLPEEGGVLKITGLGAR